MATGVVGPPSGAHGPAPRPEGQVEGREPVSGVDLLRFAQTLCAASTRAELEHRFATGFSRLVDLPLYALYVVDPWTGRQQLVTSNGVSDGFSARYERCGREVDALQAHIAATGRVAYNIAVVGSMEEWLRHPLYTRVKYLHDIRHELQTPVVNRDGVVGTLYCGTSDPSRGITPYEVRLAGALGQLVGTVVERIQATEALERERDLAVVALDRVGTAVVISDPADPEPRLNDGARRLLAEVTDAEHRLHQVISRPGGDRGFSHRVEVELVDGRTGLLHGHSTYAAAGGVLVTVLELQPDGQEISTGTLTTLTPREREVALYVVDGLSDREIAERLWLSHHTVSQYVKRIYRKLDVGSRVALTRLLLNLRDARRPE